MHAVNFPMFLRNSCFTPLFFKKCLFIRLFFQKLLFYSYYIILKFLCMPTFPILFPLRKFLFQLFLFFSKIPISFPLKNILFLLFLFFFKNPYFLYKIPIYSCFSYFTHIIFKNAYFFRNPYFFQKSLFSLKFPIPIFSENPVLLILSFKKFTFFSEALI